MMTSWSRGTTLLTGAVVLFFSQLMFPFSLQICCEAVCFLDAMELKQNCARSVELRHKIATTAMKNKYNATTSKS